MKNYYTVVEKVEGGKKEKIEGYENAKKRALDIKKETGNDCNVCSDGIAMWNTETCSNTDAIYFL